MDVVRNGVGRGLTHSLSISLELAIFGQTGPTEAYLYPALALSHPRSSLSLFRRLVYTEDCYTVGPFPWHSRPSRSRFRDRLMWC